MNVLWGAMSPQMLQKNMVLLEEDLSNMAHDALDVSGIRKLAGLGSRGIHSNNVWRDLVALLPTPKLPKLHYIFLPMRHNVLGRFSKNVPMILPHELFSTIYHHYPVMCDKLVYGSAETCQNFWRSVGGSEQFKSLQSL